MSFKVSASASEVTAIAMLLRSHGSGPAPRGGPTWSQFLKAQALGIIACDFFTVESALLKTLYVLFFIEIGTRRVRLSVSTSNPHAVFVTQQARNLAMGLPDEGASIKFLIGERDAKLCRSCDDVFASEGIRVICAPIRAPNANAFAERWIETLRADCLDWLLILGPRHLDRVLRTYVNHYNRKRPHRGLQLLAPESAASVAEVSVVPDISRRDLLGGLIHEYQSGVIEYLCLASGDVPSASLHHRAETYRAESLPRPFSRSCASCRSRWCAPAPAAPRCSRCSCAG